MFDVRLGRPFPLSPFAEASPSHTRGVGIRHFTGGDLIGFGDKHMTLQDATQYIGHSCLISWFDRAEHEFSELMRVEDVLSVPLYGDFLIGDVRELRLDRVTHLEVVTQ
jgi:hypothetical protein